MEVEPVAPKLGRDSYIGIIWMMKFLMKVPCSSRYLMQMSRVPLYKACNSAVSEQYYLMRLLLAKKSISLRWGSGMPFLSFCWMLPSSSSKKIPKARSKHWKEGSQPPAPPDDDMRWSTPSKLMNWYPATKILSTWKKKFLSMPAWILMFSSNILLRQNLMFLIREHTSSVRLGCNVMMQLSSQQFFTMRPKQYDVTTLTLKNKSSYSCCVEQWKRILICQVVRSSI